MLTTHDLFICVRMLQAVIFTLNCGADYQPANPLYLIGGVSSYRTALPQDIDTFDKFKVQLHANPLIGR